MPDDVAYTLSDLCELAEVTPRTVRYYIAEGLLRSPGAGPGARYDEGHLARLRLVKRIQREHLPLAEIRNRLRALTDDDIREIVSSPPPPPIGSAADYVRGVLAGRGTTPIRTLGPVDHRRAGPRPVHPLRGLLPTPAPGPRLAEPTPLDAGMASLPAPSASPPFAPAPPMEQGSPPGEPPTEEDLAIKARAVVREISAEYDSAMSEAGPHGERHADRHAHDLPERSQWERISLAPDLELHVRRPLSRMQNRQLSRLLQLARELLEEDSP